MHWEETKHSLVYNQSSSRAEQNRRPNSRKIPITKEVKTWNKFVSEVWNIYVSEISKQDGSTAGCGKCHDGDGACRSPGTGTNFWWI